MLDHKDTKRAEPIPVTILFVTLCLSGEVLCPIQSGRELTAQPDLTSSGWNPMLRPLYVDGSLIL
jgi:hypothetical protein